MIAGTDLSIRSPDGEISAGELRSDRFGLRAQVAGGGSAKLVDADAIGVAAALCALDGWASEVHLVGPGVDPGPISATALDLSSPAVDRPVEPSGVDTAWILYTSGTTGEPKPISHSLESLRRTVVSTSTTDLTWGLLYDPNRMAGIQVMLQALSTGSDLIAPDPHSPLIERLRMLVDHGVSALSATPSLWRQILQVPFASDVPLRQITLGGEIADQRILDALAASFPQARITHVFASTETGAAFSVKDGREGFPLAYLEESPRGIRLEIRDDILYVHSPGTSAAGDDGFASTGDVVEVVDDRVLFRGRANGVINVGGTNVWPEVVETILRQHPDVVEAVVSSKPSALVGNMLIATVTVSENSNAPDTPKRLRAWVRERAPKPYVPATVEVAEELRLGATGKVSR